MQIKPIHTEPPSHPSHAFSYLTNFISPGWDNFPFAWELFNVCVCVRVCVCVHACACVRVCVCCCRVNLLSLYLSATFFWPSLKSRTLSSIGTYHWIHVLSTQVRELCICRVVQQQFHHLKGNLITSLITPRCLLQQQATTKWLGASMPLTLVAVP